MKFVPWYINIMKWVTNNVHFAGASAKDFNITLKSVI